MKMNKLCFRALCEKVIALPSKHFLHLTKLDDYDADALLLYGFNDPKSGINFLTIGAAKIDPFEIITTDVPNDYILSYKSLANENIIILKEFVNSEIENHINKCLNKYKPSTAIKHTRSKGFLDNFRNQINPDLLHVPFRDSGIIVDILIDGIEGYLIRGRFYNNETAKKVGKEKGDRVHLRIREIRGNTCKAFVDDDIS